MFCLLGVLSILVTGRRGGRVVCLTEAPAVSEDRDLDPPL